MHTNCLLTDFISFVTEWIFIALNWYFCYIGIHSSETFLLKLEVFHPEVFVQYNGVKVSQIQQ